MGLAGLPHIRRYAQRPQSRCRVRGKCDSQYEWRGLGRFRLRSVVWLRQDRGAARAGSLEERIWIVDPTPARTLDLQTVTTQ